MGFGGISIWQLLIVLLLVVLVFGTSRLKNLGSDLGSAIKGFKKSVNDDQSIEDKSDEKTNDAEFSESAQKSESKQNQDK